MTRAEMLGIEDDVIKLHRRLLELEHAADLSKLTPDERGTMRTNLGVLSRKCGLLITMLERVGR